MWAVLPVKNLENVKTRLAPALSPPERVELLSVMLHDVLAALKDVPTIDGILVVTRDPAIKRIASKFGASVLEEEANEGHSAAVGRAARWLASRGAHGLLQVPADIPSVRAGELANVLSVHHEKQHRALTISPSQDYRGSNCVVCTPPDLIEFSFGDDSFRRHAQSARNAGIECSVVEHPGIALDIDEPKDLANFMALGSATSTHRFLSRSGLGQRVLEFVEARSRKGRQE